MKECWMVLPWRATHFVVLPSCGFSFSPFCTVLTQSLSFVILRQWEEGIECEGWSPMFRDSWSSQPCLGQCKFGSSWLSLLLFCNHFIKSCFHMEKTQLSLGFSGRSTLTGVLLGLGVPIPGTLWLSPQQLAACNYSLCTFQGNVRSVTSAEAGKMKGSHRWHKTSK